MGRQDECFAQKGLAAFLGITTEKLHEYFLVKRHFLFIQVPYLRKHVVTFHLGFVV